jgi:iron complex outermembrane receptor protein
MKLPGTGLLFAAFSLIFISTQAQQPDTVILLEAFEIIETKSGEIPYPVTRISTEKSEGLSFRDAGDFLRTVPNINGIRKGGIALDPVIRGFKYSQLNIQTNNGQKIEGGCPNRMDNPMSHVEIDDMREVEIFKGPFALRYGPGFGGIINLKTFKPAPEGGGNIHAGAMMGYESNWNGLKQQLYVKGGTEKYYFYLSGNHKDYQDYSDGNGNEVPSHFKRYNYSVQAGLTPIKNQLFLLSYEESYGRDVAFPSLPMDEREDNTRLMSFDYKGMISKTVNYLHVKVYNSTVHHIMDNKERPISDTMVATADVSARNWGMRAEAGIFTGLCQLYAGVDYENISKDGDRTKYFIMQPTLPVKVEALWQNAGIQNLGFFAEWNKALGNFRLVAALRLDVNQAGSDPIIFENMMGNPVYTNDSTSSDFVNFSFNAGTSWQFSDHMMLKFSIGRGTRNPDMNERFINLLPIGYDPYDYLGNPQLKPENNNQADLGLTYQANRAGLVSLNLFYSYVNNYISGVLLPETVVKPQSKGVLGVKQFDNIGIVWLTGFELAYTSPDAWDLGISGSAAMTYGVNPEATRYVIENGEVTRTETVKNDALPEIPPFEGNLSLFYKFFDGVFVPNASIRIAATQKHTSLAFEEDETPGFITAGFSFAWQAHPVLTVTGGINNIFDNAYYEHLNRRMISTPGNYYEPGRTAYLVLRFKI